MRNVIGILILTLILLYAYQPWIFWALFKTGAIDSNVGPYQLILNTKWVPGFPSTSALARVLPGYPKNANARIFVQLNGIAPGIGAMMLVTHRKLDIQRILLANPTVEKFNWGEAYVLGQAEGGFFQVFAPSLQLEIVTNDLSNLRGIVAVKLIAAMPIIGN